jgi:signal transduction histidine kinase/ligand-binding sensor domain-containing protein
MTHSWRSRRIVLGIVLGLSGVAVAFSAHAQRMPTRFIRIEGLSQSAVTSMIQDRRGFIWVGTQDGLNRYDGYEFVVYCNNPEDSTSINDNWIRALYEDREGFIWVGTRDGGINRFDPHTEQFIAYKFQPDNPNSLSSNMVRAIFEDKKGRLWVGTEGGGLNLFDKKSQTFKRYVHLEHHANSLSHNDVRVILEDRYGTIWVATFGGGLNKFDETTQTFTVYTHKPNDANSLADNRIRTMIEDKFEPDIIWIGMEGGGLCKFNTRTLTFKRYQHDPQQPNSLSSNNVWAVLQVAPKKFWVGTFQGGLCEFDAAEETFVAHRPMANNPQSLSSIDIWTLMQDRSGVIWVGTYDGGLCKMQINRKPFGLQQHNPDDSASLADNRVRAFYEDKQGNIWVGTDGGGISRLNRQTGKFTHYNRNRYKNLFTDRVRVFYETQDGILWLGSYDEGLASFDMKTDQVIKVYRHQPNDQTSLSNDRIRAIVEDREGMLWIATFDKGLNRFDRKTEIFTRFTEGDGSGISSNTILALHVDREGTLWCGTLTGGLCRYDAQTRKFKVYRYDKNNLNRLSNDRIYGLGELSDGRLWIGTAGGGLCLFDKRTETFERITEADGLPNNVVYGVLEDTHGNLWASTNKGISRITPLARAEEKNVPKKYIIRNYDMKDGLQHDEFNGSAYLKGRDGMFYFGGINGFNMFYPDTILDNPFLPNVVITGFKKFNQPVKLDSAISAKTLIELGHDETFISFEFAALEFTNPERNQYACKLEGFDQTWIQNKTQRTINYTNLGAGTYRFRVKAANSDGVWNEQDASLVLIIHPAVWQTSWFRLTSAILLIGVVAFAIRRRFKIVEQENLRQLENQRAQFEKEKAQQEAEATRQKNAELSKLNEELQKANQLKTEFLSLAAHDLKNPLQSVLGFAQLIKEDIEKGNQEEVRKMVVAIEQAAKRMLRLIDDLLTSTYLEATNYQLEKTEADLSSLVQSVIENNTLQLRQKNLCMTHFLEPNCKAVVDVKLILSAIDNLISNAIKYSPQNKTITVTCKKLENFSENGQATASSLEPRILIAVKDEGQGLSESDMQKLFGRFQRLSAVPTGRESSTGLGLSIVKRIVELHRGRVWAESEGKDKGATFYIELPVAE